MPIPLITTIVELFLKIFQKFPIIFLTQVFSNIKRALFDEVGELRRRIKRWQSLMNLKYILTI